MAYKKGFESAFISSLDRIEMLNERQLNVLDNMAVSLNNVANKLDKVTNVLAGKGSKADVEFLVKLGGGISSIAAGLVAFNMVPDGVPQKFNNFLNSFLNIMEERGEAIDAMAKGVQALDMIGGAILKFAYSTVLAAPGLLISILIAPLAAAAIGLYALIFYTLGSAADQIGKGADVLQTMGQGLLWFSAGALALGLVSMIFTPEMVLKSAILIAAVGGAVALVGLVEKQVDKGAGALMVAGLGLLVFSVGIGALALVASLVEWEDIGKIGALIGVAAVTLAIAGAASAFIIAGGAALAVAGIGLVLLGAGLFVLSKAVSSAEDLFKPSSIDPEKTQLEMIIGGVISAFAVNPLKVAAVILAAPAVLLAGASMMILSGGLLFMGKVASNKNVQELFKAPAENPDYDTNLALIVGSIIDAFAINPLKTAAVLLAAPAVTLAGASMVVLSGGLILFGKVTGNKDVQELFKAPGEGDYDTNLALILGTIVDAFAISPFKTIKMIASTPAFITAAVSLTAVAAGLKAFQKMTSSIDLDELIGTGGQPGTIESVLTAVMGTFAKVAKENGISSAGGVKDFLFGGSNPVSAGINAVKGVGRVLVDVAEGVQAWANLTYTDNDGKQRMIDKSVMDTVSSNIQTVLGILGKEFAAIGEQNGETGWFSQGAVEKGISSIKGVGTELVAIAEAVQSFANLTFTDPNDPSKKISLPAEMLQPGGSVRTNIKNAIISITEALAMAGSDENAQRGFFGWGSSDIDKGKEAIQGVGEDLAGIAEIVRAAAEIDLDGVAGKVANILTLVPREIIRASEFFKTNKEMLESGTGTPKLLASMLIEPMLELIEQISEMDAVVENFEKIGDVVKGMKDDINEMDLERVEALASIFEYSSQLDSNAAAIERLVELVAELRTAATPTETATTEDGTALPAAGGASIDLSELNAALQQLPSQLKSAVSTAKVVLYSNENIKIAES